MTKPVIVQSDNTLLVEVDSPAFEKARNAIAKGAGMFNSIVEIINAEGIDLNESNNKAVAIIRSKVITNSP